MDYRGPIMASLTSPCATPYRSSIDTIAVSCLVFEKIAFCILATDEHIDSIDALSPSRCRERRLDNVIERRVVSLLDLTALCISV